jgi:alkaline phosphatase D
MRLPALLPAPLLLALFLALLPFAAAAQKNLVQAGPMVGYVDKVSARLWVQLKEPAPVQFRYWPEGNKAQRQTTPEQVPVREASYTATLIATKLQPGTEYNYALLVDGKRVRFDYPLRFKTPELWEDTNQPPDFTIALGSCANVQDTICSDVDKVQGEKYQIYRSIAEANPALMLWMGDNTYLRHCDRGSPQGIRHRYTHTRSLEEMQPMLARMAHYAIWDDHDFGANNDDGSYVLKDEVLATFKDFWPNPSYGVNGHKGVTSSFQWGDAQFFMLDNRYFRSANHRKTGKQTMLGEHQIQWLLNALESSNARFKFVVMGGQLLNPYGKSETYANVFPQERQRLIELITKEDPKGVIFLSGDRHHSELTKMPREGTYPLYEFTVSPLTASVSGSYDSSEEPNTLRVEGSMLEGQHNFGTISFSGPASNRVLTLKLWDTKGGERRSFKISAAELR